jgi:hypothetical protein
VLDDALANFEGKVEASEFGIALFELFDDSQGVEIVIKVAAEAAEEIVEFVFAGMAEGRMANVVNEGEGLGELAVQAESDGCGARNLCDFERVRQAIAEMIGITNGEGLRLGFKAAEGAGMNDAIAIARVVGTIRMGRLGMTASAGIDGVHCPGSELRSQFDGRLRERGISAAHRPQRSARDQEAGGRVSISRSASSEIGVFGKSFLIC